MKTRFQIALIALSVCLAIGASVFFYFFGRNQIHQAEQNRLLTSARQAAASYDGSNFPELTRTLSEQGIHGFVLRDSQMVASTEGAPIPLLTSETLLRLLEQPQGSSILVSGETSYLAAFATTSQGERIILAEQANRIQSSLAALRNETLMLGIILVLLGAGLTLYLSRNLAKPIDQLTLATQRIAEGELSYRVQVNELTDLEPLANHFNTIADRLEGTILDSMNHQNQLDAILGSMNSGVIAVDQNNRIIIFNAFARKIFGIYNEAIGKDIHSVIRNTDLDQMLTLSDQYQELTLKRTGTVVRFKTTELITDRNFHRGKVTVLSDISDLKKLEQMRSQFVANVSHELKTPLTSIKGFAETLRDVENPATRNKFLDIIDQETERLSRLIEDILSLSAIENQERRGTEIIDAVEATVSGLHLLEVQAKNKNIDLSLTVKGEPSFLGDDDLYRQMLINLVENAIKYSEAHAKVKVRLEEEQDIIVLSVQDTGPGIPEEHLPRLFERFYRVDQARDRAKGGTGLGLAIVKHIAISFGGSIQVQSTVGEGTTFLVQLPSYRKPNRSPGTKIQAIKFNG